MISRVRLTLIVATVVACGGAVLEPSLGGVSAVARVDVSPDPLPLQVGDVGRLTCTPRNSFGTVLTNACSWVSRDTSIVRVTSGSQTSSVTARKLGAVWVVATVKSRRDSSRVTVAVADTFRPPQPDTTTPPPDTTTVPPQPQPDTGVQAVPADSFVGSMSVQTHLTYASYSGAWATVKARLLELGIRHVREQMFDNATAQSRMRELAAAGIRLTAGCWPVNGNTSSAAHCITRANAYGTGTIDAFDGWNEVDNKAGWPGNWYAWQSTLYRTLKADQTWKDRPVLGNSLAAASSADQVGLHPDVLDYGNLHSYPMGVDNTGNPSNVSAKWVPQWNKIDGGKPDFVTETGYHTCPSCTGIGVSELAQGKLTGRLWFEYWNAGILRTNFYELLDESDKAGREAHWGMLRSDGTPKPAFTVTKNLIALLSDAGSSLAPGRLAFTLTGPQAVHQTLLQKRDGHFYLVLWQEVPVWNANAKTDIANPETPVDLLLGRSATLRLYRAGTGVWSDLGTGSQFTVSVPDEVIVVEVTNGV